jgi:hypothetical protein
MREEIKQQAFDKLSSQVIKLRKIQSEYSKFVGNEAPDLQDYGTLISKIQWSCENIANHDLDCPDDCLKLDISSLWSGPEIIESGNSIAAQIAQG